MPQGRDQQVMGGTRQQHVEAKHSGRCRSDSARRGACCLLRRVAFRLFVAGLTLAVLGAGTVLRADESLQQRRARIQNMSPEEKYTLRQRQEQFARLAPQEQQRLRRLDAALRSDPQADELRAIMLRYHEWYKSLPSYQRAELNELAPAERVKRIKAIREESARKAKRLPGLDSSRAAWLRRVLEDHSRLGQRPNRQDIEALARWIEAYAAKQGIRFLEQLPEPRRRELQQELARINDPARREEVLGLKWLEWQLSNPGKLPPVSEADLPGLVAKLSPPTRERLGALPLGEQARIVTHWIRLFVLYRYVAQHPGDVLAGVHEEELARFVENHLTPEERDRILSLPEGEMERELVRRYLQWKLPGGPAKQAQPPRPRRASAPPVLGSPGAKTKPANRPETARQIRPAN